MLFYIFSIVGADLLIILFNIILSLVVIAVVAFAAIQAVYWLNLDNKIMFLLYKIFNKITDKVPRDRRF